MGKGGQEEAAKIALKRQQSKPILLTTLESFDSYSGGSELPPKHSVAVTGLAVVGLLVSLEHLLRYLFESYQHYHPILENETNRHILARHFGVDTFSCVLMTILCYSSLHVINPMWKFSKKHMPDAGFESRLFTYHPAGFRIGLFFFFYQAKNLYDTIIWNDGPEFVFHHIMSMVASYCVMYPGAAHFYVLFYLGISEISTAVLCVLANFDDQHGVPGLADAFPTVKMATAGLFVVTFIICRVILWPIASYYLLNDCTLALKSKSERCTQFRGTCRALYYSCASLSALQVVFLATIIITGKKEIEAML